MYIIYMNTFFVPHSMGMCHSASKLRQTGGLGLSSTLLYVMKPLIFYGWTLLFFSFFFLCF